MADIKNIDAYVLVNPHNNRLIDNKIPTYPDCFPDYTVRFGPSIEDNIDVPFWYKNGTNNPDIDRRGYCAYLGHYKALKDHFNTRANDPLLIMEDDVVFNPNFSEYYSNFIKMVPDNWDAIYFGYRARSKPIEVVPNVLRLGSVVGLECVLLKDSMARFLFSELTYKPKKIIRQVDVTMSIFSNRKIIKAYAPIAQFAHQKGGYSAHFNTITADTSSIKTEYIDINGNNKQSIDEDLNRYKNKED